MINKIVTTEEALEALENMDDYARMNVGVNPFGPYDVLKKFIEQNHNPSESTKE